ncbi:ASCH domain-containing protein [Bradyrhizobium sp. JYMT SZCCT0428]|uniref:ASCH domain-containing protein n=1 Tax=Bradyrhizobium sp. JYMT SZCCT0428 TaxID=2807673 RepID=UPI001BAA1DEA|nr:ASCH domain-containing protein [Bradyrhizobium sp. JYMT SZCCT0428]MBR1154613.1 ASCH domain-containing protein [Bradyrhizobium sp. JYMT SZCCT0428]
MKIISIRQPWASLIVSGVKDVENRSWSTSYRGLVLIHASRTADNITDDEFQSRFEMAIPAALPRGGVVGIAEIVDCVSEHPSRWYAPGHFAFVLANARSVPFFRWQGTLSLREAPATLIELLGQKVHHF